METVIARRSGIEFHHPIAFWVGTLMLGAGVLAHLPMFMMAAPIGFKMVDMPVDGTMIAGMFLIVAGLMLSVYGLIPRRLDLGREDGPAISLVSADNAPLTRAHGTLFIVLIVALVVDIMKPASLGFVMPGLADEYNISRQTASWLAISALTGTAVGSVIWGLIADILGRRCAILISSLMFVGTAICGAMPAFEWNLFMCFLMGASAGGLLPIAFTLMAETVPSRHRGWMLVLLGGIGTTGGYLAASLCAAWLEPQFGWRVLWFLNFPTGLLLIALNRFLPESPRFLVHVGRNDEARHVLESYGVTVVTAEKADPSLAPDKSHHWMQSLFGRSVFVLTTGLVLCGLAWGLVNFGFLLWLPSNLRGLGMVGGAGEALLDNAPTARAAVEALLLRGATALPKLGLGCMMVTSAVNASSAKVRKTLTTCRATEEATLRKRIERGIREGELPAGTDAAGLAKFYETVSQGMSTQIADGASPKILRGIIANAMRAWPEKKAARRKPG